MRPMILALLMLSACSDGSGPGDKSDDPFRQVSVGDSRVCAVVESGAGYCWGRAFDDYARSDSVLARYGGDQLFRRLSPANGTFGDYICGLAAGAGTLCQGFFLVNIDAGGLISSTLAPVANDVPLDMIATSSTHFCGLTEAGAAWCWGDFNAGVLLPNLVQGGLTFTSIGAGVVHTCARTAAGAVYCWGADVRLGAPSAQLETSAESCGRIPPCAPLPVQTELPAAAQALFVGPTGSCAITVAAELWCWGLTFDDGATSVTPHQMAIPAEVGSVALGDQHACMLTTTGEAYCLGWNDRGQLGTGEAGDYQFTPVRVAGDLRFTSLSAGWDTTCGVTAAGLLYCWGSNEFGQLATGDRQNSPTPVRVRLPA
jgi:alpha-tubulin suppressor-like RCC1 family protein